VQEADVLAVPDPNTFEVLPWGDPKSVEARVFCDIHHLDGSPFEGDPRQVLRRNLDAAHEQGFTFYVAPDIEFFYFAPPEKGHAPTPLDEGGFFDLTTTDVAGTLRKETIRTLETMSIPVEYSFHEDAPSQHEIDLRHTDALNMADSVMTFRLVVKEVAAKQGVHATFMPKPLEGVQGSGMHMHFSLFQRRRQRVLQTPTTRTTCRRSRSSSWPACCATPRRSPRSPTRRSTATSGWCPASRHPCTSAGRATTAAA
jgi:glutamine synthetase